MIHSLSGGVLSDGGVLWFAKVDVAGTPCWYLSPHTLAAGTRVRVPFGGGSAEGEVLRIAGPAGDQLQPVRKMSVESMKLEL